MFNTLADRERLMANFKGRLHDHYFSKHYGCYSAPIIVQAYFFIQGSTKFCPFTMQHGTMWLNYTQEREFDWLMQFSEMEKTRATLFENLEKDLGFGKQFYGIYENGFQNFVRAAQAEEKIDVKNLSNEEIVERLLALVEAGFNQGPGYTVDCLLATEDTDWFKEFAEKFAGLEIGPADLMQLREATDRTFVNEYRLRILEAANAKTQGENIEERVKNIQRDFYWVENNYLRALVKSTDEVHAEIAAVKNPAAEYEEERTRMEKTITRKEAWFATVNASPLLREFVVLADKCIFIQDCRKQIVLRMNHFIFSYLYELADRLHFPRELIGQVQFFEWSDFIKNPESFRAVAEERERGFLGLFDKDGLAFFTRTELKDLDLSNFFKDYSHLTEAKGIVASVGEASGRACVILGSDQFAEFQTGDVLITNQTTPDFVPLMKRASAILAEQGGITSHAAVVSRELGVPCLVGVKNAMTIFKTGEQIFVDARKGIVRKI